MRQFTATHPLLLESVITLTEATALPFLRRRGKRPALTTLLRWARRGINGQRLETVRIGRSLCTSAEAIERFIRAVSDGECHAPQSAEADRIRSTAAEHELAAEGIN